MADAVGRLRQLGDNATEGPWDSRDVWADHGGLMGGGLRYEDAEFIAAARNVWDALLDVAEAGPEAVRLLEAAQESGLPSCRESTSWENPDQHDAMCKVRKAADRLRAALGRLDKETP